MNTCLLCFTFLYKLPLPHNSLYVSCWFAFIYTVFKKPNKTKTKSYKTLYSFFFEGVSYKTKRDAGARSLIPYTPCIWQTIVTSPCHKKQVAPSTGLGMIYVWHNSIRHFYKANIYILSLTGVAKVVMWPFPPDTCVFEKIGAGVGKLLTAARTGDKRWKKTPLAALASILFKNHSKIWQRHLYRW